MAFRLRYVAPSGREWPLMAEAHRGVWVNEDSFEELMGLRADTAVTAAGVPGQRVTESQFTPIGFTLACTVVGRVDRPADLVWADFRADWVATTSHTPGVLLLDNDGGSLLRIPVRLNGRLPGPPRNPSELEVLSVMVPVVGDGGRWLQRLTDTGSVTVTNVGVGVVWPEIVWQGAGGAVTLPSGAALTLPPVAEERRLLLSPWESHAVLTPAGDLDPALHSTLDVVGEGVPEGTSRTYAVPVGARLEWDLGFLDPWR